MRRGFVPAAPLARAFRIDPECPAAIQVDPRFGRSYAGREYQENRGDGQGAAVRSRFMVRSFMFERIHFQPFADEERVGHERERAVVHFRLAALAQLGETPIDTRVLVDLLDGGIRRSR